METYKTRGKHCPHVITALSQLKADDFAILGYVTQEFTAIDFIDFLKQYEMKFRKLIVITSSK